MNKTCIPKNIVEDLKIKLAKGEITPDSITKMLPEEKQALKSLLEDVVSKNLGVKVSSEEVAKISDKAKKLDTIQKKLGNNFGDIANHYEDNLDFLKAKREMDNLIAELNPSSKARVFSGTIVRGAMLTSIKSPVLNIGSNTVVGITEALQRRLSRFSFIGGNNKLALDYLKKVNKIYQETGYDISRAIGQDFGDFGSRVLGEKISAKGVKGGIGKVGRFFEDVTFKQLMGAPDVAFSSAHFADSVNLGANKLAKGDKNLATEMMKDAMSLDPKTDAGKLLKAQGVLDAEYATYTNKSALSKASEGIRKTLNDLYPDARIGDWVMPFVKTPANVLSASLDYAGLGVVKGFAKFSKMIINKNLNKEGVRDAVGDMVRTGLGFTGAVMLASQIDENDFVGAYDPARKQIEELRNSNTNSIKLGNKWISLDWFGPLSAPLTGMLYAKKYGAGNFTGEKLAYTKGAIRQLANTPGLETLSSAYSSLAEKGKDVNLDDVKETGGKLIYDQLGRLIPSIISDVAKAFDPYERETKTIGQKIKAKIPVFRQNLPIKKNIFSENIKGENAFTDIIFGARVKTSTENSTIKKINDLVDTTGKNLSITDWDKTTSKQINEVKNKVGSDKFNQMKDNYGKRLKNELDSLVNSPKYQISDDLKKINLINSLDEKVVKSIFKENGLKYK